MCWHLLAWYGMSQRVLLLVRSILPVEPPKQSSIGSEELLGNLEYKDAIEKASSLLLSIWGAFFHQEDITHNHPIRAVQRKGGAVLL